MTWRVAEALRTLRAEVDVLWPNRRKDSDGSIGDALHASRTSDHNPWVRDGRDGVVTAIDITHDPQSGCDTYALAEQLRTTRDPRIKYVISNRKIFSSDVDAWGWRAYSGINPHNHHVHVSVKSEKELYDSKEPWSIDKDKLPAPSRVAPAVPPTLRVGDKGEAAEHIQQMLQEKGMAIKVDGEFGLATAAAVRAFQIARGLVADGVVGPQTWAALSR